MYLNLLPLQSSLKNYQRRSRLGNTLIQKVHDIGNKFTTSANSEVEQRPYVSTEEPSMPEAFTKTVYFEKTTRVVNIVIKDDENKEEEAIVFKRTKNNSASAISFYAPTRTSPPKTTTTTTTLPHVTKDRVGQVKNRMDEMKV
ncbi:hypothetical protein L6452_06371 [Arctium lappa]|uniref:Uncharacterized protein n=1 Tax=Arctium lappa TaxID=4217 RepID=A0ACB9EII7_ARCLA|nr:hypothetical protein L6452_06371 [Arctium lappa]